MSIAEVRHDIPASVLDQALQWAVVMCSGTAGDDDRLAFDGWLRQAPVHQTAWQRIQMIEEEFMPARVAAESGTLALKRRERQRRKQGLAVGAGGLLSLAMLMGLVFHLTPGFEYWQADYATAAREQQRIELPGGAVVHLNSETALDIETARSGITVRLRQGEILVDSAGASAQNKPRVITPDARLTPIGTRFVVTKQDGVTELAVVAGRVAAEALNSGNNREVKAGESVRIIDGRMDVISPTGMTPGVWTDHVVEADNARLGDVLDALSSHRRGWLRYDRTVADLRVTGVFRLDDTDSALLALERTLPVRIERTTDWWVRVSAD